MAYNLDAIKQKIADLSGGRNGGKSDRVKLTWFKPSLLADGSKNSYEIRFMPYTDRQGQPFEEVSYYDNKELSERRFVSPAQYQLEDPIFDLINELRKENTRETWRLMNNLRPKDRFYAPIVVRGEEDRGVQIWELNSKILKDIYSILAHPDYADEDMMDAENGFDFTLDVEDSGKMFGKWKVKNYNLTPRRKPTRLAKGKKDVDALVASVPDLEAYFKGQVRNPEQLQQTVENFLAKTAGDDGEEDTESKELGTGKDHNASKGADRDKEHSNTVKSIEDAFADLDDDVGTVF